eukprot:COSAG02_NODE_6290_length_3673_cov_1.705932_3_plen_131_part_00
MQRAAEAPQSWGLPRALRRQSIARKKELKIADQMEHPARRTQVRAFKNDLSSGRSRGVTEQRRREVAEELAKVVLARTVDNQAVPAEPLAETDNEELSAEDLALQQRQFVQFAEDGTTQRPFSSRFATQS